DLLQAEHRTLAPPDGLVEAGRDLAVLGARHLADPGGDLVPQRGVRGAGVPAPGLDLDDGSQGGRVLLEGAHHLGAGTGLAGDERGPDSVLASQRARLVGDLTGVVDPGVLGVL